MQKKHIITEAFVGLILLGSIIGPTATEHTESKNDDTSLPISSENENDKFLLKDSKKLKSWINNPNLQHTTSFYFYDVQNADSLMKGVEKPIIKVKERGPYVFREQRIYEVDSWEQDDDYLNLKYKKQYFPVDTEKLEDEITVLNVPLIFAYHLSEKLGLYKKLFYGLIKGESLFIKRKVGDLLFNGYNDKLIKILERAHKYVKGNINASTYIKNGKFSLMQMRNDSTYGDWTVKTGKSNIDELGEIFKIDGNRFIGCWDIPCNIIKGNDGIIHHPKSAASETIEIYVPELNRTVQLDRTSDKFEINGQITSSFKWSDNTFKSAKEYERNECFYPKQKDTFDRYSGIHRNSHCNYDSPIMFSNPHFYQADNYFLERIDGLKPASSEHSSNIYLTNDESVLVNGNKRIQINIDTKFTSEYRNIERFIFPLFWLDEQTTNLKYSKKL